jgi:hypothetical protein
MEPLPGKKDPQAAVGCMGACAWAEPLACAANAPLRSRLDLCARFLGLMSPVSISNAAELDFEEAE